MGKLLFGTFAASMGLAVFMGASTPTPVVHHSAKHEQSVSAARNIVLDDDLQKSYQTRRAAMGTSTGTPTKGSTQSTTAN